ncbi:hypothetical protein [Pelagibius sp. Alg239-R121]|uniref:hypothetical protein n=1 Tax=Pelagibius sp. Alg239-R121 TaxID=2993448 RepID=UPI0024A61738|nr:hypothetical protein [Pelagibius sp. Alg239-R121]
MTPALRFLEQRLPPICARVVLMLIYAVLLISIIMLAGSGWIEPILYEDVQ